METINGMFAISQIMSEMHQATMGKTDWNEGWDKETYSDNWGDSHSK